MTKYIHTRKVFNERRKELRRNSTPQEQLLWKIIRNKKLGVRFERQHSIGPYIVDFYCPEKKLIIEIDGNQHLNNKEYDVERSRYLEHLGYVVLRFWNNDIDKYLDKVLTQIRSSS